MSWHVIIALSLCAALLVFVAFAFQLRGRKAKMQRLFTRIEQEWTHLGETEPHWSVLTVDRFKAENIAAHEEEFFASGKGDVDDLVSTARRNGINVLNSGICFELGCGMARSTIWLAKEFSRVIAADISPAHLDLARQTASRYGRTNIDFLHVNSPRALAKVPEFDVFFSIIVLQHNPPPLISYLLRHVLRRLRQNGIAYFQLPTFAPGYSFSLDEYLAQEPHGGMEMHVLLQPQLLRVIEDEGGELIEIRADGASGPDFVSKRVLVQKKRTRLPRIRLGSGTARRIVCRE